MMELGRTLRPPARRIRLRDLGQEQQKRLYQNLLDEQSALDASFLESEELPPTVEELDLLMYYMPNSIYLT